MFKTSTKVHKSPLGVLGFTGLDKKVVVAVALDPKTGEPTTYRYQVRAEDLSDEVPDDLSVITQLAFEPAPVAVAVAQAAPVLPPIAAPAPAPAHPVVEVARETITLTKLVVTPAPAVAAAPPTSPPPPMSKPKSLPDSLGAGRPFEVFYVLPSAPKKVLGPEKETVVLQLAREHGEGVKVTPAVTPAKPWETALEYFTRRLAEKAAKTIKR